MKRFVFQCRNHTSDLRQRGSILLRFTPLLGALHGAAWAQAPAASEPAASGGLGWFGGELLLLALLAVCAWTVFYVLQRKRQLARGGGGDNERVHVLGITPLGARERLAVLRVRDRTLLVGVTAAQITLLADLGAVAAPAADNVRADSARASSATTP
jgi:flagellar biogenesis protein FliO